MNFPRLIAGLLALSIPVLVVAASNADGDFRECMRHAMDNRENRLIDITKNLHSDTQNLMYARRDQFFATWDVENDRDRNDILRNIDKEIQNALRNIDRLHRDNLKVIRTDFRNDEKVCRDALKQREKERRSVSVGKRCFGTDQCAPPGGICTIEFGDCTMACRPGLHPCQRECAGTCVLRG